MRKLAMVVPSLNEGGGVPAVARFVKDVAIRSGHYDLKIVSLCMSSSEPSTSLLLTNPTTWFRGVTATKGEWQGLPFVHVGATFGELEFQRYKPRKMLTNALSDCDLIQVVCGSPAWANAVVGLGTPVALQVATRSKIERRQRDANLGTVGAYWRKAMTEITNKLDDRALRRVDAIQVENPWMLDYAKTLNSNRDVDLRYAPPGVDSDLFHPLPNRDIIDSPYILCVGRMADPRKNIEFLLHAYSRLSPDLRQQVHLVLAGSSAPPVAFWKEAKRIGLSDRISYIAKPSRAKLVQLYQNASVFALPSDEEGLGVVLLEAMACAVPVVSTKSGGPDGIISDGKDGFLVPRGDVKKMATCLSALLKNPSFNLDIGQNAHKKIKAHYDERIVGSVFLEMWDRLIESRTRQR